MPQFYCDRSLKEYLTALASSDPVPGGGAASALTAAMGTALLAMAGRYACRRPGNSAAVRKRLRAVVRRADALTRRLLRDADRDAAAYLAFSRAPGGSARRERARRRAIEVPMNVAGLCYEAVELAPDLVRHGSPHLTSDVEIAVEILYASYRSALINVRVNQPSEGT